jgi:hypothetical protein
MQCSGQEYEKLVSEVVIKLWSYVSTSKDVEVISAALRYVNISILIVCKYFFCHVYFNSTQTTLHLSTIMLGEKIMKNSVCYEHL